MSEAPQDSQEEQETPEAVSDEAAGPVVGEDEDQGFEQVGSITGVAPKTEDDIPEGLQ